MLLIGENFFGLTTATAATKYTEFTGTMIVSVSSSRYPNSTNSSGVTFIEPSVSDPFFSAYIPNLGTVYTGIAFKASTIPTVSSIFNLFTLRFYGATTTDHVTLRFKLGELLVYYNNSTLLGSYVIPSVSTNTWYYVELGAVIASISGSVEVRLDGTTVISASNVNTQSGTNPYANNILIGSVGAGFLHVSASDWYVCDTSGSNSLTNTFLGDIRVVSLIPSQSGDQINFGSLSSSLNSALMLDDANLPDGDATYVSASAVNSMDLYKMTQYTGSATTVYGLVANAYAKKTDAGSRQLSLAIKSGSNISYSPSQSLTFTYGWNSYGVDINPATSAPWASLQDIMNSQVGFKIVK